MRTIYFMILLLLLLVSNCLAIVTATKIDNANSISVQHRFSQLNSPNIPSFLQHRNTNIDQTVNYVSKPTAKDRPGISILANGSEITNVNVGGNIVLTVNFSTGFTQAIYTTWIDMNANNLVDENIDVMTDDPVTINDNDAQDENPANGVYQYTLSGNENGPTTVANIRVLFRVADGGGSDAAAVHIMPVVSDYSVAGNVTPAMSTLIVMAYPVDSQEINYMTTTNANGSYLLYFPSSGHYTVMCFDPIFLTGGLVCETTYQNLFVNGHLTGYDFAFTSPTSSISGYVRNQDNVPVPDITVYAELESGGTQLFAATDNNGYYHISLGSGTWRIGTNANPDDNNYLSGSNHTIIIGEEENLTTDFTIYATDGTIQGSTYVDGVLTGQIRVRADCIIGSSNTTSNANGYYTLKVSSLANNQGGYNLFIQNEDLPSNTYCLDNYQNVMSGAINMNFNIHTVTGGIEGHLYNSQTSQPISENAWISANSNMNNFNTNSDNDGSYQLGLPSGTYSVTAGGNNYYSNTIQNVNVGNSMQTLNFNLVPVVFTGSISGTVTNSLTSLPINGVNIQANVQNYSGFTYTDSQGHYNVQLPNGTFTLYASAPNYYGVQYENLVINNNNLTQSFSMTPSVANDDPINPLPTDKLGMMNYPNPFNPETTLSFNLPKATNVKVDVLNIRGQIVRTLLSENMSAGIHSVKWDGTDSHGQAMASGVYLYRVSTPAKTITNKMIMLK